MNIKIFSYAVIALILDQFSKIIVSIKLTVNSSLNVIPNFFTLQYLENSGAAWNLLNGRLTILVLCSVLSLLIIYRYMYNFKNNFRNSMAFGLLMGGIIGNLIDRLFLGYVRDFLAFRIFNYNYPVFNLADTFIVVGVILLIIAIIKGEDKIGN